MSKYSVSPDSVALYAGSAYPELAQRIADGLGVELGPIDRTVFADGERRVQYEEVIRGQDLYLIQPTCPPVNDHIMELVLMVDAARRAGAGSISAVMPYLGYSRQDRVDRPRVPISSKAVASALEDAGIDRILTMNLHSDQIQGFYDVPVNHFYSAPVLLDRIRETAGDEPVMVAPDAGAANRVRAIAERLDYDFAVIDKRRPEDNVSEVAYIVGDVEGRDAFLLDDMIDTGGTITEAAQELQDQGARSVFAATTHPILSDPALSRIEESPLQEVLVCNTIPLDERAQASDAITTVDVSGLIADAIALIQTGHDLNELYV